MMSKSVMEGRLRHIQAEDGKRLEARTGAGTMLSSVFRTSVNVFVSETASTFEKSPLNSTPACTVQCRYASGRSTMSVPSNVVMEAWEVGDDDSDIA